MFSLDIEAGSERGDLKADDLLGKGVSVEMQCPRGGVRYFHGFVSRFSRVPRPGTRYFAYRLTAVPWLSFLTLIQTAAFFKIRHYKTFCATCLAGVASAISIPAFR